MRAGDLEDPRGRAVGHGGAGHALTRWVVRSGMGCLARAWPARVPALSPCGRRKFGSDKGRSKAGGMRERA
jgi:hypothetical protein